MVVDDIGVGLVNSPVGSEVLLFDDEEALVGQLGERLELETRSFVGLRYQIADVRQPSGSLLLGR
jgi:hypothetical protein